MAAKVTVRFARPHGPYNPGDIAGFDGETAQRLIEAGRAAPWSGASVSAPEDQGPARRVAVRFMRAHGAYNPGDVAGFEVARAAQFVAEGVAVPRAGLPDPTPEGQGAPEDSDPVDDDLAPEGGDPLADAETESEAAPAAGEADGGEADDETGEPGFAFDDPATPEPEAEAESGAPPVQGQI